MQDPEKLFQRDIILSLSAANRTLRRYGCLLILYRNPQILAMAPNVPPEEMETLTTLTQEEIEALGMR